MATSKKKPVTKTEQIAVVHENRIKESVKGVTLQGVLDGVTKAQLGVQAAFAEINNQATKKIEDLTTLDSAIELKKSELKTLHEIDAEAITLDELKARREETVDAWQREQDERAERITREESERQRVRMREEEEFSYNRGLERKKADDTWQRETALRTQRLNDEEEQRKKDWGVREDVLKTAENELATLRKLSTDQPVLLKKAEDTGFAKGMNTTKSEMGHELALVRKDTEAAQALFTTKLDAATQVISAQTAQIKELQAQLAKAQTDNKEIAAEAVRAASGKQALEVLQKAQENAANAQPKRN